MTERTNPSVVLVEDNEPLARSYAQFLRDEPIQLAIAATGTAAWTLIDQTSPAVCLLDLQLPDMNGMEILQRARAEQRPTRFIVITADASLKTAVEAMKAGALDFLVKPFAAERLRVTLRNALEQANLARTVQIYREEFDRSGLDRMIGSSLPMQAVYRVVASAARSKAPVFITGESGTGKELCAEAIHRLSSRASRRLVALNCAVMPRDLMESHIFGHVRGAFTGAVGDRDGAAKMADGGTLFLDELCEMDIDLQAKLLRFLQTGSYQPVGSSKTFQADIRLVAATNRDPLEEVRLGRFREDLYYRLHVIPIEMPPLRERGGDVLQLAEHILALSAREEGRHFRGFEPAAAQRLLDYGWPGNVRQLQNVIRQIVVLNDGELVSEAMLPALPPGASPARLTAPVAAPAAKPGAVAAIRPLWQVERDAIEAAIAQCGGNVPRAAALLEISPSTIYRKRATWEEGGSAA